MIEEKETDVMERVGDEREVIVLLDGGCGHDGRVVLPLSQADGVAVA